MATLPILQTQIEDMTLMQADRLIEDALRTCLTQGHPLISKQLVDNFSRGNHLPQEIAQEVLGEFPSRQPCVCKAIYEKGYPHSTHDSGKESVSIYELFNVHSYLVNGKTLFWDNESIYVFSKTNSPFHGTYILELLRRMRTEAFHIPGSTLVLWSYGASLFSHWLMDALPKAFVFQDCHETLTTFDHVLVPRHMKAFHRETIAALGISQEQIIECRNPSYYFFDHVVHVSPIRIGWQGPHWLYTDYPLVLKSLQACHDSLGFNEKPRRVYLPRTKGNRRLLNAKEVSATLKSHGFCEWDPAHHSVFDTAHMMSCAETVVGSHGAGMANIVFSENLSHVMELTNGAHSCPEYQFTSSSMGASYSTVEGNATDMTDDYSDQSARQAFEQVNRANYECNAEDLSGQVLQICSP